MSATPTNSLTTLVQDSAMVFIVLNAVTKHILCWIEWINGIHIYQLKTSTCLARYDWYRKSWLRHITCYCAMSMPLLIALSLSPNTFTR
jgi:hypothetical protein